MYLRSSLTSKSRYAFLCAFCLILVSSASLFAQTAKDLTPKVIPPSPNSASLGKFVDAPVGFYTGTPQISVPLYEVVEGDLKLPIKLDYHASGIKLAENPSWIGTGWALSAGGVITRSIRGTPDEGGFGISGWIDDGSNGTMPTNDITGSIPDNGDAVSNYFARVVSGAHDLDPDIFYFNFAGKTGRFSFDAQGNVHITPFQKIKIIGAISSSIKIVTEDGTQYTFGRVEKTVTKTTNILTGSVGDASPQYPTAWYLTEIASANGGGKITLNYNPTGTYYFYRSVGTHKRYEITSITGDAGGFYQTRPDWEKSETTTYIYDPVILKSITTPSISIDFTAATERCDLKGDFMLDEMTISNRTTLTTMSLVKKFSLIHKYYNGYSLVDLSSPCNPTATGFGDNTDYSKRLFLTGVSEIGSDGQTGKLYTFGYNLSAPGLPSRLSFNQDHWGYFNGSTNDYSVSTLIPSTPTHPGASRDVDEASTKIGVLTRITFPTGGYTDYDYELNDINNVGNLNYTTYSQAQTKLDIQPTQQAMFKRTIGTSFQINDVSGSTLVKFLKNFSTDCNDRPCPSNTSTNPFCGDLFNFEIYKYSGTDSTFVMKISNVDDFAIFNTSGIVFQNGTYKIQHYVKNSFYTNPQMGPCYPYFLQLTWSNSSVNPLSKVGGLRVKKITSYMPDKTLVKTFEYKTDDGKSSGYLVNAPSYKSSYMETYIDQNSIGIVTRVHVNYDMYTSYASQPLGNTQGSCVGYNQVTMYIGEDANNNIGRTGKTVMRYTNPYTYPDLGSVQNASNIPTYSYADAFPFAPHDNQDYLRGLLLEKIDYAFNGTTYVRINNTVNTYSIFNINGSSPNYSEFFSWRVGTTDRTFFYTDSQVPGGVSANLYPVKYKMRSGHYFLTNTSEYEYDITDQTKYQLTSTDYTYGQNHLLEIEKKVTKSNGDIVKIQTKYPSDFTSTVTDADPASAALAKMVTLNKLSPPVEQRTLVNDKLTHSLLTTYKEFTANVLLPYEQYLYSLKSPLTNPAATSVVSGQLQFTLFAGGQGYEKVQTFSLYDAKGNVRQVQKANDLVETYLWGYNASRPVAEIKNATYQDVVNVIGQTAIDDIANSYSLSAAQLALLNGLRTNPTFKNAQTTVYTYDPIIGVLTSTDANGKITYYDYDSLGRLLTVRDYQQNVIKRYQYNYKIVVRE